VFEGDGVVTEHAGGYTDWRNELARIAVAKRTAGGGAAAKAAAPAAQSKTAPAGAKLNNKERKELEALPSRIEQLEAEQAQLTVQLGDPEDLQGRRGQGRDAAEAAPCRRSRTRRSPRPLDGPRRPQGRLSDGRS
jgi:ATP-binding cassette subfamily F protein uup